MTTNSEQEQTTCCNCCTAQVMASWLLRLWLGVRSLQTGIEKFGKMVSKDELVTVNGVPNSVGMEMADKSKHYALSFYHGLPEGLATQFSKEPLLPSWALSAYGTVLGPLLILLGLTVLLGFAYRTSLFIMGLVYISLTFGLILIDASDGIAFLGVHMLMIVAALALAKYNRLAVPILKKW